MTVLERFELYPVAPFRLDLTVWVLRRRPHNAVDNFDGEFYRRVLVLGGRPVEVSLRQVGPPEAPRLAVELRSNSRKLGETTVSETRIALDRMLGLGADLAGFYRLAEDNEQLKPLAERFVGMRPTRFPSVFEALVNAIACQQLSLIVGIHLLNRLAERYGPTASRSGGALHGFPIPERLAEADPAVLRDLGFSKAKARYVTGLAQQVASGDLDLETLADIEDERALAELNSLAGVGRWSAEYTLLRGLGRLNVLPGDDVGARNNLQRRFGLVVALDYGGIQELSRTWSPYGGLVYFHLLLDSLAAAGNLDPTARTH